MSGTGKIGLRAVLAGLALALIGWSAGYLSATLDSGDTDAHAAEQTAYEESFAATQSRVFVNRLVTGVADGIDEGAKRGAVQGGYHARDEALSELTEGSDSQDAATAEQGARSESRQDIGYDGNAARELRQLRAADDVSAGPPGGREPARYARMWRRIPAEEKQWAARVAECESGTDPTLTALGGDYRGAFMFTPHAWVTSPNSPGGDPIDYSYLVQAVVAISLKGRDGVRPWPVCGPRALEG